MMSKISRFHRIRGGGDGSDYNRCVEFLAKELKALGLKDVLIKKYITDGFKKSFLWLPEMHGAAAYLTEHQDLREKGICGLNLEKIGLISFE